MKEINTLVLSLEYALTNQSLDIPTATLSILQDLKKQGLVLGLTSAKPVSFLQRYLRIKRLDNLFSFLIGSNGAEYYNMKTHQKFVDQNLTMNDLVSVYNLCRKLQLTWGVIDQNELYLSKFDPFGFLYALRHRLKAHYKGFNDLPKNAKISQILIFGNHGLLTRFESNFIQAQKEHGIAYPSYDLNQFIQQNTNEDSLCLEESEMDDFEDDSIDLDDHSFHVFNTFFESPSINDEQLMPLEMEDQEHREEPAINENASQQSIIQQFIQSHGNSSTSRNELQALLHRNYAYKCEQLPLRIIHNSDHILSILPPSSSVYLRLQTALEQFKLNSDKVLYYGATDKDSLAMLYTYGIAIKGTPRYVSDCCHMITKYNGAQNGIGYNLNALRVENNFEFCKPKRKKAQ
ncbi:HAD hydrolase family protein [Allobaculum stercoricanis]|uniref:HAD hydrolase family protein n=1 Tax=Allobaculum stercoricanis TaxID=174709 RepID=UPI0029427148|nr:HAD hydrolase family protein [Allobaculum stercoricanis]